MRARARIAVMLMAVLASCGAPSNDAGKALAWSAASDNAWTARSPDRLAAIRCDDDGGTWWCVAVRQTPLRSGFIWQGRLYRLGERPRSFAALGNGGDYSGYGCQLSNEYIVRGRETITVEGETTAGHAVVPAPGWTAQEIALRLRAAGLDDTMVFPCLAWLDQARRSGKLEPAAWGTSG